MVTPPAVGGPPPSSPPPSGEPPAVLHETEQFLTQHLPDNINRESLSAALGLLSNELSSGNVDLIQKALDGLVDRLPISDSLKTVIKALIPAYASQVAETHAAGGPTETDTTESLAALNADLNVIEFMFTAPPHLPELPPVNQTLIDSFRASLESLRGQTITPEEFTASLNELLENFEDKKSLLDRALWSLRYGLISPEEFQTLAEGILTNLEAQKTFQDAMHGLENGTINEEAFQKIIGDLTKEIEQARALLAAGGAGGSGGSSPVNIAFWMFSCSVEFFKIASNISQILTEMEREQNLLAIKMKQCMIEMAKEAFTLGIAMTEARVKQIETEAYKAQLEGICSFVQAGISAIVLIGSSITYAKINTVEGQKQAQFVWDNIKGIASGIVTGAQELRKAAMELEKAGYARTEGYSEASKELLNKIFQTMQDSLQKIQEGTSKIQEILKELWGMTQSIQRLSGEVRG